MNYTNIGTMTYSRISSIRAEERLHWYLGLRQSELEFNRLKPALELAFLDIEEKKAEIGYEKNKSTEVNLFAIKRLEIELKQLEDLLPGAISEFNAIEGEYQRIVSEHFEELKLDKNLLEQSVAKDCSLARAARFVRASTIRPMGFSDSEAQLLLELPEVDLMEVMARVHSQNYPAIIAASNALSKVSPLEASRIAGIIDEKVTEILMLNGVN